MAKETIIAGLDIGTSYIRTIIAKVRADQSKPQIIGVGQVPSFGLRKGLVIDIEEVAKSIRQAKEEAERAAGVQIRCVYVSVGGEHISSRVSKGVVAVSRADSQVSEEDVDRAINAASAISIPQNREILHVIPRNFILDEQKGIKDPVGMNGVRLEVDALIIEGSTPFIKNLIKCVSEAGLEIEGLVLASLASSRAVLSKRQKELGVLNLDLGGGTVDLTVFEEGDIIHSHVLPIGSSHITNDIAIGLRTTIDLAERVKLEYGSALTSEISKKENIDLSKLGLEEDGSVPRVQIAEIIEARLCEILELTNKELKKIDRQGLLPAGIVLLGGGSKIPGLVDLTKDTLKLPAQIGFPVELTGIVDRVDDPAFATAVGLVLWGFDVQTKGNRRGIPLPDIPGISQTVNKIKNWFRDFLP
ncbi:MAG: cell division protein FtsA [Candidatus Portnoybacteria bacterium RIFCSPLOWO2_12_FULL_39_9]|uniref:Cell division protein FtsA n=1 Tax=Candidatus Portnoybacteria bacterium RIFCSPHIGHO2_12_FULL_38_9 TaxID=1801997 RepID=A0A1G2FHJ8_9BACT|nr:MAG: cell division protein FtsA [Candidatus Portnoybacteria bacterium RBG_13_40_8]OGZ37549.1 MAG: cell division protein FtsA [Candidatus Portnoybacteria bacterium RIFCSPHIGHO2_12_FULL_38_9]OGZ39427.1 MAG: cell division protein FtsA [Candidatus Portnoybacteria bacterium RIFCSPLOWO2_01_FULL_38_39]OGZ41178.1 MAG: cell division protein FtsA [Candidatus Portnoybacteria bacterium RIFCSPLOWO2_12_FULL_39_9]